MFDLFILFQLPVILKFAGLNSKP